jgi:hypothetical protein
MTYFRIKIRLISGVDKDSVFLTKNTIIPNRKLRAKNTIIRDYFKKIVTLIV